MALKASHALFRSLYLISVIGIISFSSISGYKSYKGYELIRIYLPSQEQIFIQDIIPFNKVDVWKEPHAGDSTVDVMLTPKQKHSIYKELKLKNIHYEVLNNNVESLIQRSLGHIQKRSVGWGKRIDRYMNYLEMMTWLDYIAEECNDCFVYKLGDTFEKRHMKVIRIGSSAYWKPIIWIDAGIHGREWIAPAAAVGIIEKLIRESQTDPNIQALRNNFTWYIMPLANPDGYDYTWTYDRLWRKTRSINPHFPRCRGVDPNRNWDYHWSGPGNSIHPCDGNYRGHSAFSEPETRVMSDFLQAIKKRTKLYLTLHSYGQYWLTPWGYTKRKPADYRDLHSLAKLGVDKLKQFNETYTLGTSGGSLYLASGGSDDWAKGVTGIKYSYTVELAEKGLFGFIHYPHRIKPVTDGLFEAVKAMALQLVERLKADIDEFGSG